MKVDPERVARLSAEILERVERLAAYTAPDLPAFLEDERNVLAVKMLLVEAVEGAAALCNHIMARKFRQAPGRLRPVPGRAGRAPGVGGSLPAAVAADRALSE
jgi:hypothetical protein